MIEKIPTKEDEEGIYYTGETFDLIIKKINEIIDWINSQS